MNLYRQSNGFRTHGGRRTFLAFTVLIIVIAFLDLFLGGRVRSALREFLSPIARSGEYVSSAVLRSDYWSSRKALMRENQSLREELNRVRERSALFDVIEEDNASLRSLARLAEKEGGVTAEVISSFRASPYGTFLIGAGKTSGVDVGSIVMSGEGFVLGTVMEAASDTALVKFAFAPENTLDVSVGNISFSLTGRGLGNARAQVSREVKLEERTLVRAPIFAQRPVGIIGKIESASSSAYSDIFVYLPTNLNTIRFVHVLPPHTL